MATAAATTTQWPWPDDVLTYAVEHGFDQQLPAVLAMTKRILPSARRIQVSMEPDLEVPDFWFTVFEVEVSGMSVEQMSAAQWCWCGELTSLCPAKPGCFVVLSIEPVDQ